MDELNNMNLDELLNTTVNDSNNSMTGKLFENADVEIEIKKEEPVSEEPDGQMTIFDVVPEEDTENREMTKEEFAAKNREDAMKKLAEYEDLENKNVKLDAELALLNQKLDTLISQIKIDNKELLDEINTKVNEIEANKKAQDKVKEELLPLQKEVYLVNNDDKTLKFNKIQSTYVAATEKNKFDLKKFREEQPKFWKENLAVMEPYAEITAVSDYLKITISKK